MKNKISMLFVLFCFASCISVSHYQDKRAKDLVKKYGGELSKPTDYPKTIGESKQRLSQLERYMALSPDSMIIQGNSKNGYRSDSINLGSIDSFYNNKYKINYIKKNNLLTTKIHFYSYNEGREN